MSPIYSLILIVIFYLSVSFGSDDCKSQLFTEEHGDINFTRSVSSESHLPDCEWRITVPKNKSILLNIIEINVRYRDKFEVYDGDSDQDTSLTQRIDSSSYLSLTASAIARRRNLLSSGNQMLIKFKANDDYIYLYSKRNYTINMRYSTVSSGCGGTFDELSGVIKSPGYPNDYYSNIECKWRINVAEGNSIIFVFDEFKTEQGHDFLKFDSYGLVKFSGHEKPPNFISNSNSRDIYFETDETNTDKGFKITYKALALETNKTFLIFATDAIIRSNTTQNNTIAVTGHKISKLFEFDFTKDNIFWFEPESRTLNRKSNNVSIKSVVITGRPNSLALDYIHDNIYWIDIKSKTINVMNILDQNSVYIVSRLEGENPRDLIINMKRSALVWSDVGSDPKIMYSNLDGSERKVLYSESRQAMHLTIDYENERYFFIDITDHSLYSIDFNGNNEKFFIQSTLFLDIINSMTVLNNDLYLANEYMIYRIPELDLHLMKSQVLYKVHYFPNFELDDFIMTNAKDVFRHKINGFRILDPIQQPIVDNRCEANICQGICLPNANSYRCLDSDEKAISPSQLALKDLDDTSNTHIYREKSTNTLSIFNLIFFFLLLSIIALMSFSIFRLKKELIGIRDNLIYQTPNPRLSLQENRLETDVSHSVDSRSYQNLLEMEDK